MTRARKIIGFLFVLVPSIALAIGGAYTARNESKRLALRQELVYAMLDSTASPCAVVGSDGQVIFWNDALEKLTGVTETQAKAGGIEQIIFDEAKRERHREALRGAFLDPSRHENLTTIHCLLRDSFDGAVPIVVSVRIVETRDGGEYAVARIDKESKVVEIGSPTSSRIVTGRKRQLDPLSGETEIQTDSAPAAEAAAAPAEK